MPGKKIIYHCYGGAHSSITCAAIHLGKLKTDKTPTDKELLSLSLFDRQSDGGHGQLHFFGVDEWDNQVYTVGCRNVGPVMEKMLRGAADILGLPDELKFVDTLHCVTITMRVGGFLSRRLGWITVGRPLVVKGTQEAYQKLVQLVSRVKEEVKV